MTTRPAILGLDIGGANLKAAHADGAARTMAFPLWKHPERLVEALVQLVATMPAFDRLAVTMTGELCDCFETKREGVRRILDCVKSSTQGKRIDVWTTRGRFASLDKALEDPLPAAAANWLALAEFVARRFRDETVVLIDTGSTTTDIIYLNRGKAEPRGWTDPERMKSGELVYTGMRRTPICSVLGMEVAAEFFATMLDAYICAGLAPEDANDRDTADGRPATRQYAEARLARMLCADTDSFSSADALALARRAVEKQGCAVAVAMSRVLEGRPTVQRAVIGGSGAIVGTVACQKRGITTTLVADMMGADISVAACAYAVAMLAAEAPGHG